MAHFAKLDDDNSVLDVFVVHNESLDPENEEASGIAFLTKWSNGHTNWKQTSYNTNSGEHANGKAPLRKNYAGVGMVYDEERDAFYYPQPYPSWIFDEETAQWNPPVPQPPLEDGVSIWDEESVSWKVKTV